MCWERRECSKKFVVAVLGLTKGKKKKGSFEAACTVPRGCSVVQLRRTNTTIQKKSEEKTHCL
jgi:hypothetical protein